jgi:hypothetical protein
MKLKTSQIPLTLAPGHGATLIDAPLGSARACGLDTAARRDPACALRGKADVYPVSAAKIVTTPDSQKWRSTLV